VVVLFFLVHLPLKFPSSRACLHACWSVTIVCQLF
jgi:hypothetical protein